MNEDSFAVFRDWIAENKHRIYSAESEDGRPVRPVERPLGTVAESPTADGQALAIFAWEVRSFLRNKFGSEMIEPILQSWRDLGLLRLGVWKVRGIRWSGAPPGTLDSLECYFFDTTVLEWRN